MTLDVKAIKRQKIALGMVENPACWRLRDLASEVRADHAIVELGAFKGRSTGWLALGATNGNGAHVYSIDPWDDRSATDWPAGTPEYVEQYSLPETQQAYEAHLDRTGIRPYVTPVKGFSLDVAKAWKKDGRPKIGLLWHDAAHHYEEVLADLRAWLPLMAPNAVVVLHDAGNPDYGVVSAAEDAFKRRSGKWDWAGREIQLWPKSPQRRGILIVRTKVD